MANLEPTPILPYAKWVPIVGAGFGGFVLLALLWLVRVAGENPIFICNSFLLIAAVFALGAALAAGFIGGSAAFQGQLGPTAQNNAIVFTAGGGVAVLFGVLFGMFFIFNQFWARSCDQQDKITSLTSDKQHVEGENAQLKLDLAAYKGRDMRIFPQASDQIRSLKDKIQISYDDRNRADVVVTPQGGVFVIPMKDFDEGSTISIGTRANAAVARPADTQVPEAITLASETIGLSGIKYLSGPNYVELQLLLNVGGK